MAATGTRAPAPDARGVFTLSESLPRARFQRGISKPQINLKLQLLPGPPATSLVIPKSGPKSVTAGQSFWTPQSQHLSAAPQTPPSAPTREKPLFTAVSRETFLCFRCQKLARATTFCRRARVVTSRPFYRR